MQDDNRRNTMDYNILGSSRNRDTAKANAQFVGSVDRHTITRFSKKADSTAPSLYVGADTNLGCILHILIWMANEATSASIPQPLPQWSEVFEDNVPMHRACSNLGIPKAARGDECRNALVHYIKMAQLTLAEFAMHFEVVAYDGGLLALALQETREFQNRAQQGKMSQYEVPEWEGIKAYCKENGIERLCER